MKRLTKDVSEELNELVEEATELLPVSILMVQFKKDPIKAFKNYVEYLKSTEELEEDTVKEVNAIIEGLSGELTKEKALVIAKEYIKNQYKHELNEITDEKQDIVNGIKDYVDTIKSNLEIVKVTEQLKENISKFNDISHLRTKFISTVLENHTGPLFASDISVQKTPTKLMSDYRFLLENLRTDITVVEDSFKRLTNDLLYITAKGMIEKSENLEDVYKLLNVEEVTPLEPTDNVSLKEAVLSINNEIENKDIFNTFKETNSIILAQVTGLEETINKFESILNKYVTESDSFGKPLDDYRDLLLKEVDAYLNGDLDNSKPESLVYLLAYVISNTVNIANNITKTASDINSRLILVSESIDLNNKLLGYCFKG